MLDGTARRQKQALSRLGLLAAAFAVLQAIAARGLSEEPIRFKNLPVGKVLFLGNSITRHPPAPGIGWILDCGMAASAAEKDYVHLLTARLAESAGDAPRVMAKNIADFERQYDTYDIGAGLKPELEFSADLVVLAIGENVAELTSAEASAGFTRAVSRLLGELKRHGHPTVFVRSTFWANPAKDLALRQAAKESGAMFVELGRLDREPANLASSERAFENAGVGGHPGDRGMRAIADVLWKAIAERAAEPAAP